MKSIMQMDQEICFICKGRATEEHHAIHGTANRKLSEKYGLKVYLCPYCHRVGKQAVHKNAETDERVKREAQKSFTEQYPDLDFLKIFGRNYL
jgi:hypothetical protein